MICFEYFTHLSSHIARVPLNFESSIFQKRKEKKIRTNIRCPAINYIYFETIILGNYKIHTSRRKTHPTKLIIEFITLGTVSDVRFGLREAGCRRGPSRNNGRIAGYIADNPPFWSKATGSPIIAGAACTSSRKKAARERWRWRWPWRPSGVGRRLRDTRVPPTRSPLRSYHDTSFAILTWHFVGPTFTSKFSPRISVPFGKVQWNINSFQRLLYCDDRFSFFIFIL